MASVKEWSVALRDVGFTILDPILSNGASHAGAVPNENSSAGGKKDRQTFHPTGKAILLIRLDAIGDFVVGLDAVKGLREYYANAEITLVGNALWTDLAKHVPYVDQVISVDPYRFRHDLRYRYDRMRHLTRRSYQAAIHLAHRRSGRFVDADAIVRAVEARQKIASCGDAETNWRVRWSNQWYTEVLPVDRGEMELRRNAQLVRGIGARDFRSGLPTLPLESLLPVEGLPDAYYVLFPGAGADQRRWPPARFAKIADRLERETGWTGMVCGGPREKHLGEEIRKSADATVRNWIGRTSIPELASVIAGGELLVGNETSAVHLATAVSTPSVCVLGGGHHGRFVPYDVEHRPPGRPVPRTAVHEMPCFHCDWNCCFEVPEGAPAPCINRIPTDVVWAQVQSILAEKGAETTTGPDDL